jgi:hypothetical protein
MGSNMEISRAAARFGVSGLLALCHGHDQCVRQKFSEVLPANTYLPSAYNCECVSQQTLGRLTICTKCNLSA